jgi:hypothetical protein
MHEDGVKEEQVTYVAKVKLTRGIGKSVKQKQVTYHAKVELTKCIRKSVKKKVTCLVKVELNRWMR